MDLLVVADLAALPERPLLRLLLGVEVLVVLAALPERPLLRLMLGVKVVVVPVAVRLG